MHCKLGLPNAHIALNRLPQAQATMRCFMCTPIMCSCIRVAVCVHTLNKARPVSVAAAVQAWRSPFGMTSRACPLQ
jgi:hypothetical protein